MTRRLKTLLFLFVVAIMGHTQDAFSIGTGYLGMAVFCSSQKDAEVLAQAYLVRGASKFLEHKNNYHYTTAVLFFTVSEAVSTIKVDKKSLYIIKVQSGKTFYLVSRIPATVRPPPDIQRDPTLSHLSQASTNHLLKKNGHQGVRHEQHS